MPERTRHSVQHRKAIIVVNEQMVVAVEALHAKMTRGWLR